VHSPDEQQATRLFIVCCDTPVTRLMAFLPLSYDSLTPMDLQASSRSFREDKGTMLKMVDKTDRSAAIPLHDR
jgi:hypothetical protein